MRRSFTLFLLLFLLFFPMAALSTSGCGKESRKAEVTRLLERRIGEIQAVSYTCVTEDAERTYREEIYLRFPASYTYRLYDCSEGQPRLLSISAQTGSEAFRAGTVSVESGATALQIQRSVSLPPLRGTGFYLSVYHLLGNGDYFQSLAYLIDAGTLEVEGREEAEGKEAWLIRTAAGLQPGIGIWLDPETGLPLKKELALSGERTLVFRYRDVRENPAQDMEPFPPDISDLAVPSALVQESVLDGGCRALNLEEASSVLGFSPLLPELEGFVLEGSWVRDPRQSSLGAQEQEVQFPEGFRELYLTLRNGPRQAEIRESPYGPGFSYYTTGIGMPASAYISQQESWGEGLGNAMYTAALDCQELRLVAGDLEIIVTGDLTRQEMETLAGRFRELAGALP